MSRTVMLSLLIEPLEAVAFAPPKSNSAGESHHIQSSFPPSPRTVQGILRTALLDGADPPVDLSGSAAGKREIAELVGPPHALPDGWQLRGPFPAHPVPFPRPAGWTDDEAEAEWVLAPWVPAPRILMARGKRNPAPPVFVHDLGEATHRVLSDLGDQTQTPAFGRPDLGGGRTLTGWIGPTALRRVVEANRGDDVLFDGCCDQVNRPWPPFVYRETHPGLAIDRATGTAQDNALYFTHALRFTPGSGFYEEFAGVLPSRLRDRALSDGAGQIGRKGRLARLVAAPRMHPDWDAVMEGAHLPEEVADRDEFWLLALTPVFLTDPRTPALHDLPGGRVTVTIRAALTGKLETVGGFDLASGRPRPNRRLVPAGSAWRIRLSGGTARDRAATLRALHNHHPLGDRAEAAMGFGHTLIGRVTSTPAHPGNR